MPQPGASTHSQPHSQQHGGFGASTHSQPHSQEHGGFGASSHSQHYSQHGGASHQANYGGSATNMHVSVTSTPSHSHSGSTWNPTPIRHVPTGHISGTTSPSSTTPVPWAHPTHADTTTAFHPPPTPSWGAAYAAYHPPPHLPLPGYGPPPQHYAAPLPATWGDPHPHVPSTAYATSPYPPPTSIDEEFIGKQLLRDMQPFHGGAKSTAEWPIFWTCMQSILTLRAYLPLDGLLPDGQLVTTAANAISSNALYILLVGKLRPPAIDIVHNNITLRGRGFELMNRLRQTYAPQGASHIYSNFLSLFSLAMGPKDTVDSIMVAIRQYALALASGGCPVPPQLLSMVFMKGLDDHYTVLKHNFVLDPDRYARMDLDKLYATPVQFNVAKERFLGEEAPPFPAAAAATSTPATPSAAAAATPAPSATTPSGKCKLNADDIKKVHKAGNRTCGRNGHTIDKCSQYMHAGFLIEFAPDKAQAKWDAGAPTGKRSKHSGTPNPDSGAAASSTGAPGSVGGAAHASTNMYAPLDSDDDVDCGFNQDVGATSYSSAVAVRLAVSGKAKSNSSLYLPPSSHTCIGYSSHVASSVASTPPTSVLIADSGATDHMWPHYEAFTSYMPLYSKYVTLADNPHSPVAGIGSIKILLDGHVVGVRNVLHVPDLRIPLYSLRTHRRMKDCGFIGDNSRFHVYFPEFVTSVQDDVDSYIPYTPLGQSSSTPFTYRQPAASRVARPPRDITNQQLNANDDITATVSTSDYGNKDSPPKSTKSAPRSSTIKWAPSLIKGKSPSTQSSSPPVLRKSVYPNPLRDGATPRRISKSSLLAFLPFECKTPPPIRPCDTPNGSDTTRHFTADQIYKLFGDRRFRNYSNFCLTTKDSKFINGGDPVPALGEFTTIHKHKKGAALPRSTRALDKVHCDIVFGDGIARLGYKYAIIFVDRATRYIWVFSLKSLHADALIAAFQQFRAEAGKLATQFRTDCDGKIMSQAVISWLRSNGSDIASAPAGRQSSNGLV
jgi:hypothetical protein